MAKRNINQQAETDQPDPAEVRNGAEAFCRLLLDIKALREVTLPGRKRGEDDSLAHNYVGAERLIHRRLGSEEFEGEGRYVGYIRALAAYITKSVHETCPGDEMTADEVLEEFARLNGANEVRAPAESRPPPGKRVSIAIDMQASIRQILTTIDLAGEDPHELYAKVCAIEACVERAERVLCAAQEESEAHHG